MKNLIYVLAFAVVAFVLFQIINKDAPANPAPVTEEIQKDDSNFEGFGGWEQWEDDFKNVRWSKEVDPKENSQKVFFQIQRNGFWRNVRDTPFNDFGEGWSVVEIQLQGVNEQTSLSRPFIPENSGNRCT